MKTSFPNRNHLIAGGEANFAEIPPSLSPLDEKVGTAARPCLRASTDWREHPRPLEPRMQENSSENRCQGFFSWLWEISGMRQEWGNW